MGGHYRPSKLSKKKIAQSTFPQIFVDRDADFASIKFRPGVEAYSYVKDGFLFCEDKQGRILELQILNLSHWKKPRIRSAA